MIDGFMGRSASQQGHMTQSPAGGPGIPPQNQAALASTAPSYESRPYQPRDTQPMGPPMGPPSGGTAGPPPSAPSSQPPLAHRYGAQGSLIASAYQNHLGRDASEQEIGDQLLQGTRMDTKHVQNVLNSIRNSQEARDYQTRQAAAAAAPPPQAPAGAAPTGGVGQYGNLLEGFGGMLDNGQSKLLAGDSPKYQFGRAMSQFDPKGGISQELLDALNALGLGTVTGQLGGDKISIGGQVDPRFEGVTEFDIIRNLEGGGGWQWGGLNGKAAQPQMGMGMPGLGMGGMSPFGAGMPSPMDPLGGGDYTSQILQYIAQQLGMQQALQGGA